MKQGARALGIAESYDGDRSTLAGVVTRASRVVDGFAFASCTVGGTDSTAATCDLYRRLDRADVQYLFLAGIAPAWYNVIDLQRVHEETDRPVLSISFEDSEGLESAIEAAFDGDQRRDRLAVYRAQPRREPLSVNGERLFCRSVGIDAEEASEVVRAFTPEGGRPEPLRVARLAARAADAHARD